MRLTEDGELFSETGREAVDDAHGSEDCCSTLSTDISSKRQSMRLTEDMVSSFQRQIVKQWMMHMVLVTAGAHFVPIYPRRDNP